MDFFKELADEIERDDNDNDLCLISKEPIDKQQMITLSCGHKFNYTSLYNELLYLKKNKNISDIVFVNKYQIKCPYCRKINDGILPMIKGIDNVKRIKYINSPDEHSIKVNNCSYIFKSGKKKGTICNKNTCNKLCYQHFNLMKKNINKT